MIRMRDEMEFGYAYMQLKEVGRGGDVVEVVTISEEKERKERGETYVFGPELAMERR